ncbi:hypothetical protein J4410_05020, partial [Candidatus Woesearchaeota archaeon]|nr:hypothetical protein [Candidatus Woesearchaeota archaeon]
MALNTVVDLLSRCGYSGSFKPTVSLAKEIGKQGFRDFLDFDSTTSAYLGSHSREHLWGPSWDAGEEKNLILVEGHHYDSRPFAAWLRMFIPSYGMLPVISIAGIPGKFAREQGFSVDKRTNRKNETYGTAFFGLDFLVSPDNFAHVLHGLRENPNSVFDLISQL